MVFESACCNFFIVPDIFMPTADTNFSVLVNITSPSISAGYHTLQLVKAGGTIRLYVTNNFPSNTSFTLNQTTISYNVV